MSNEDILVVKGLKQHFKISKNHTVKAVDGIDITIKKGETFGLVGESGSGKSTTGRSIIRLYDPTAGEIIFDGKDISGKLNKHEKKALAKDFQMIFQDPFASVNPRMTVEEIISEGMIFHFPTLSKFERKQKIIDLLETVGLSEQHMSRYSHEFSGGQLQRVGIARALAVEPKLIIADEAISALDVSIQAQVVNLLKKLQTDLGLTILFIAHDLSMVKYISDRVGVMHKGKLLEIASSSDIYSNAIHPYTKSLLSAIPHPDPDFEQTRVAFGYDPNIEHDYSEFKPAYHSVGDNHLVFCSEIELKKYLENGGKSL